VPNHPKQEPGWLYLNRVSFPASWAYCWSRHVSATITLYRNAYSERARRAIHPELRRVPHSRSMSALDCWQQWSF